MKLLPGILIGIVVLTTAKTIDPSKYVENKSLKEIQFLNTVETENVNKNNNKASTRVAGGSAAKRGMFPYQVKLKTFRFLNSITYTLGHCGGSLISKDYVLTAAHCIIGKKPVFAQDGETVVYHPTDYVYPSYVDVLLGFNDLRIAENGSQSFRVDQDGFIVHGNYNPWTHFNDIALLRLPQRALLNDFVDVINLPQRNIGDLVGQAVILSGWGLYYDKGDVSNVLRYAKMNVANPITCFIYDNFDSNRQICFDTRDRKSSCQGDSGGPEVIIRGKETILAGIVSFGYRYGCTKGYPVAGTRVSYYLDWIHAKTNINIE